MDILKALVARVARAFYDPKYIAILDALNNAPPNTNGYFIWIEHSFDFTY
jgi:transcription initiation factor TFIIE subunit alpha